MKIIMLVFYSIIFVSCTSQVSQNNATQKKREEASIEKNSMKSLYVFENDTLKQTVEVRFNNETEIVFTAISQNKKRKQESKIEGIAIIKDGDVELDEDADGNAYPVNEYIYDKECWLAFRIDKDTKTKMLVNEADCNLHTQYCPFASFEVLTKQ